MDLSLSAEQKALQKEARDFLGKECPWTLVKQLDEGESGFSPELWRKIVGKGWVGFCLPEKYGGKGRSLTDAGVLYEEMGRALLPGPYFSSGMLCGEIINEGGTDEQKRKLLPAIARGEKILALALTEPDYGWEPECIHLSAKQKGSTFILDGVKCFVHDAQVADQLICVARTQNSRAPADGITLFLVDRNSPGISCRNLPGFVGEKQNGYNFKFKKA